MKIPVRAAFFGLVVLVFAAYSNHFHNSFHFDDSHALVENPWIREVRNIPRFFTDVTTSSTLPPNRSYRPLVTASLALDYRMGHGLNPLWFHISTFVWFLLQLYLMFVLFNRTLPSSPWVALLATALYGVHPVIAETLNYVVQRAELYFTLDVVAALAIYVSFPRLRRYGFYLLPVVTAILSKLPAAVFPVLLLFWIWFFDEETFKRSLMRTAPAIAVSAATTWLVIVMTPPAYSGGAATASGYLITQPNVLLGFFLKFFVPARLTADTDHEVFTSVLEPDALLGFIFIALLVFVIVKCAQRRELRPIAFGLAWFLTACLPTALFPVSEVENDHRMYFPFVGLTLAVAWASALAVRRWRVSVSTMVPVTGLVLAGLAWGTWDRNKVWHTEESLWENVTVNSPRNGRGLMNYGLALMAKGEYPAALDLFQRALVLNPNYSVLEINLGIVYGAMNNRAEAERHFLRAIALAPVDSSAHYFYARWLSQTGRSADALEHLRLAVQMNPDYLPASYLLMQNYAGAGDAAQLRAEAQRVLARFPSDAEATAWLARSTAPAKADDYLNQSNALWQAGKFTECIAAAQEALKLRPDYPEAWNNIAAAYGSMAQWDREIEAATKALQLKPGFQLAKNNLAWALSQKRRN